MTIFDYVAQEEQYFRQVAASLGYAPFTTFYKDLSIAECWGASGIMETFERVSKEWLGKYKFWTEFALCLNWKSWEMADRGNHEISALYADLWYKARDMFYDKYTGNDEATSYFFEVTD